MAVLGICAGTALASYGEVNSSALGISIMFAAEVTEAVRLVLVQYLLKVSPSQSDQPSTCRAAQLIHHSSTKLPHT